MATIPTRYDIKFTINFVPKYSKALLIGMIKNIIKRERPSETASIRLPFLNIGIKIDQIKKIVEKTVKTLSSLFVIFPETKLTKDIPNNKNIITKRMRVSQMTIPMGPVSISSSKYTRNNQASDLSQIVYELLRIL